MLSSSIYMNCGSQNNLVEPYVGVGIFVSPSHISNIDKLLIDFPSEIKNLSPLHEKEVLRALYRIYSIFEYRDEEQPVLGDFILVRGQEIDKYGHHVACSKAIRSLSIRMRALTDGESYVCCSDGSRGKEIDSSSFRLAVLYSRYIRSFFLASYRYWFPNLPTLSCPDVRPLPPYYVNELVRRSMK